MEYYNKMCSEWHLGKIDCRISLPAPIDKLAFKHSISGVFATLKVAEERIYAVGIHKNRLCSIFQRIPIKKGRISRKLWPSGAAMNRLIRGIDPNRVVVSARRQS